jgi:hypothetical protein
MSRVTAVCIPLKSSLLAPVIMAVRCTAGDLATLQSWALRRAGREGHASISNCNSSSS